MRLNLNYETFSKKDGNYYFYLSALLITSVFFILFILLKTKDHALYAGFFYPETCMVIPVYIISALSGYFFGFFTAFVAFFLSIVIPGSSPYSAVILMLTVLIAYKTSFHRHFKKPLFLLLSFLLQLFVTGPLWNFVRDFTDFNRIALFTPSSLALSLLGALPVCVFPVFLLVFFFNFAPDREKESFYLGILYTKYYEKELQLKTPRKNSRIGPKIISVVMIEALILTTVACCFVVSIIKKEAFFLSLQYSNDVSSNSIPLTILSYSLRLFIVMFICVIPVISFSNYWLDRYFISPIKKMSEYMRGFARTTDENRTLYTEKFHDLKINSHDEIAELYHSVDIMIVEINVFIDALKEEQKIAEKLQVSIEANKAKSNFLSNMSHEIRTPINAVLGMDEMILRECTDKKVLEYAHDIKNSGKSLLALVNDILDFSKIEAGKMKMNLSNYDWTSLCTDVVNMISVRMKEKDLEFKVEISSAIPRQLFGDEMRIKQVLLNILTNAVKYTEKGSVTFSVWTEVSGEDEVLLCVSVADTGIGIKKQDMERMVHPFERLDENRNKAIEGTGLGMSIIVQLLNLMGSHLDVESKYGIGSVFSFKLPQKVMDWTPIGDYKEASSSLSVKEDEYYESFHAPDARILVVDDINTNLKVMKGLLKETEVQVDTAESGEEALKKVALQFYNIIFIDHKMPVMDGIETFHAMQKMEGNLNKGVPCIALTANAISGAREMYLNEGFSDYLPKPVDPRKLEAMIMKYLPKSLYSVNFVRVDEDWIKEKEVENHLSSIPGIDFAEALEHCGTKEVFFDALKTFYENIPSNLEKIRSSLSSVREKGTKDYTILVHSLKSTARLIGARELSEMARKLESAGDASDFTQIENDTPLLLELYSSYHDKIEPFVKEKSEEKKELMDDNNWKQALQSIKDFSAACNWDGLDMVMNMLKDYKIPEKYEDEYTRLKEIIMSADHADLEAFLADINLEDGVI